MALGLASQHLGGLKALQAMRQTFLKDHILFVRRLQMIPILKALGAMQQDFDTLPRLSDCLVDDPTLPFRKTRGSRFSLDFNKAKLRRLEAQPFVLSQDDDFIRHDSGQVRVFDEIQSDVHSNTVFQALLKFKAFVIKDVETSPRPKLDYNSKTSVSNIFTARTTTHGDVMGEPALEGVHCDGADFTMTTLISKKNMRGDSARTSTHSMKEQSGVHPSKADPSLLQGRYQHLDVLDTLLFSDNERKHSVTTLFAEDPDQKAERDMLVAFTRKPALEGHVLHQYDSFKPHTEMPLEKELHLSQQPNEAANVGRI